MYVLTFSNSQNCLSKESSLFVFHGNPGGWNQIYALSSTFVIAGCQWPFQKEFWMCHWQSQGKLRLFGQILKTRLIWVPSIFKIDIAILECMQHHIQNSPLIHLRFLNHRKLAARLCWCDEWPVATLQLRRQQHHGTWQCHGALPAV